MGPEIPMPLPAPFKIERYFAKHEFSTRYLLSSSDCESLSLRELLDLADADGRERWDRLTLGYTESAGHPVLRAEIARLYPSLSPEDVLVAVPIEAMYVAMNMLLRPGDHVVALFPAYQALYEVARSIGCKVDLWGLSVRDGRWHADLDELARLLRPETRLLVLNFPHNPTGYQPSRETFEAILALARQHGLYVFGDEMYRFLEHDESERLPPIVDAYERSVALSGLSKAFGVPGLRIGWLATRDRDLLARCLAFKDYTTICHSAPSELLGIIALRAHEALSSRNREIVRANARRAAAFFGGRPERFRWLPPQAGSVAFPEWLGPEPVEEFCATVLEQAGVMIVPGEMFDLPGRHFRVGLGRRDFVEALSQLEAFLKR